VAVGRRTHNRFGGDIGSAAWPVLDDERLTKPFGKPLSDQARLDVWRATR
jgi:hypothetical protein